MTQAERRRKWWVMAAVSAGAFLSTLDASIVNVALPSIAQALAAPFEAVQWIVLAYMLTLSSTLLSMGHLARRFGKKRIYGLGFIVFSVGSVCCALSPSVGWLIGARVLQGLGAAQLMALGAAVVVEAFPATERGKALGLIGSAVSLGLVTGPALGGIVLMSLPWQALFLVNVPFGVLGAYLVRREISEQRPSGVAPFSVQGSLLWAATLLGASLLISARASLGLGAAVVLGAFTVICGGAFSMVQRRSKVPLSEFGLLRGGPLPWALGACLVVFFASAGFVLLVPFFLQNLQGRSPHEVGLMMMVPPLLMGVLAPFAGWVSDRVGPRMLSVLGLTLVALGYYLVSGLSLDTSASEYLLRIACIGVGMGLFLPANNSTVMGSVPREQLGVASSLLSLTRTLGQMLGVALVGAAWALVAGWLAPEAGSAVLGAPHQAQRDAFLWMARGLSLLLGATALLTALAGRSGRRSWPRLGLEGLE